MKGTRNARAVQVPVQALVLNEGDTFVFADG
jgi:hypothetical protein